MHVSDGHVFSCRFADRTDKILIVVGAFSACAKGDLECFHKTPGYYNYCKTHLHILRILKKATWNYQTLLEAQFGASENETQKPRSLTMKQKVTQVTTRCFLSLTMDQLGILL